MNMKELLVGLTMAVVAALAVPTLVLTSGWDASAEQLSDQEPATHE
jgi:hypothetical protein